MRVLSNFHAHSTFCDGSESPESMVKAAISKGCTAFGISGHTPMGFDTCWTMTEQGMAEFIKEMERLKTAYVGQLALFCGVERDIYSPKPQGTFDYVIGSVHYIKKDGTLLNVDESEEAQRRDVQRYYSGDFYSYTKDYFDTVADIVPKTAPDFIGHFDLVTKFNENGKLFDEADPRYYKPALEALTAITERQNLFELNTGAMYRVGRTAPYPSVFLLKALRERGGEIILSSDSHDGSSICYKFDEMTDLLKNCGFRYAKTLTKSGFTEFAL